MGVGATNGDMGFMGKLKFNINDKTGQMKASSDVFADAVDQAYMAAKMPADKKEEEIKQINLQMEALSSLQSKVSTLASKSSVLFRKDAYGNTGVFANLSPTVSSNSSTLVSDLMNLNVAEKANLQEFTIEITQVASYDSIAATAGAADTTSDLNWSGTITLNGQDVTITNNMSLDDVQTMINSYSEQTNVKATIVKVASNDHRLTLQAVNMAEPITIVNNLAGALPTQIPVNSGKTADQLSAKVKFNDVTIVRTTNSIDDIVDGLTLVAKKEEPGTKITIRLSPDEDSVRTAISDWVDSINDVIEEVEKHKVYDLTKLSLGDDSILNNTPIVSTIDALIKNGLAWTVSGVSNDDFHLLDQVGIKLNVLTGKYDVDVQALDEALKNNFDGVKKLFEYQETISNSNFLIGGHPASIPSNVIAGSNGQQLTTTMTLKKDAGGNFSADITINGGDYAAHTFTIPSSAIKVTNGVAEFSGTDAVSATTNATPFKDFNFVYVGTGNIANNSSDSTTVKITQGFADRFKLNVANVQTDKTGAFALQKSAFADKIASLKSSIEVILQRADKERERIEKQFSRLEAVRQALMPLQTIANAFADMMAKRD